MELTYREQFLRKHGVSPKTGFLAEHPPAFLPHSFSNMAFNLFLGKLDSTLYCLERLVAERQMEEAAQEMPEWSGGFDIFSRPDIERLQLAYAMLAHAFWRERYPYKTVDELRNDARPKPLPKPIAVPLWRLSRITGRQPSMSYGLYAQHNWKFVRSGLSPDDISLDTITPLHTFTGTEDERWFIKIHQVIDFQFTPAITPLLEGCFWSRFWSPRDQFKLSRHLPPDTPIAHIEEQLAMAIEPVQRAVRTLARVRERCDTGVYFNSVRMFYTPPPNIQFEGVPELEGQLLNIPGETGGQNPTFHFLFAALGMKDTDYHIRNRSQCTHEERAVIASTRADSKIHEIALTGREPLRTLHNELVQAVIDWRTEHKALAEEYIAAYGERSGTMKWALQFLEELRQDAIAHLVP